MSIAGNTASALSGSATGNLAEAGSSAVQTPLEIFGASRLMGWYREDDVTLNVGDVSSWNDQSTQGNDCTQGTASKQPTYNSSGSGLSGSGAYLNLERNTGQSLDSGVSGLSNLGVSGENLCIFALMRPQTGGVGASHNVVNITVSPVATTTHLRINGISGTCGVRWGPSQDNTNTGSYAADPSWTLHGVFTNTADYPADPNRYIVGATEGGDGTSEDALADTVEQWFIGTSNGSAAAYDGDLVEVIIIRGEITSAELASIQAYHTDRYGYSP